MEVFVPLDQYVPYQVRHEQVAVVAYSNRLIIHLTKPSFPQLEKGMKFAARALEKLPQTPVTAAGINCRFKLDESEGELANVVKQSLDTQLVDADFNIKRRGILRSVQFDPGEINLTIKHEEEKGYTIELNFNLEDKDTVVLKKWVERPISEIEGATKRIMEDYLLLELKDEVDAKAD